MTQLKKLSGVLFFVLGLFCCVQAQSGMNWASAPNLLSPRDSAATVVNSGGNIFVLGGNTTLPLSVDTLVNGALNWTVAPPIPQARIAPGAALAPNGQIFVFGGKSNGRVLKETLYYNPTTGAASSQASMKSLRYRFASVNVFGTFYVFGGLNTADQQIPSVEVYSSSNNKWNALTDMPEARSNFSAVFDGTYMMTFGGSIAGSAATNTVYRYQYGGLGTFSPVAPMPIATRDSAVVLGANRLIYVIGGFSAAGTPIGDVQIYDIANDSWRVGASLPVAVGVAGYSVYVSTTAPTCGRIGCTIPPTNIAPAAVVDGTTTSVTVNNLTRNTGYGVWVVAFDAAGNTSFLMAVVRPGFVTLP